jgi:sterol desaturase/sphingolipid hydroxylase (fatty acid hydroxylase superfamily)
MNEKYVGFAIPIFFLLIGVELAVGRARRKELFRFEDSITDLSCGVGQQMILPFFKTVSLAGYVFLYEHRFFSISSSSVLAWVALVLGVDLGYYAFHRFSHRVNLYWASHVVHHQSEEYNLAVALRQSWIQKAIEWVFYLPLAIVGFPPEMFLLSSTANTLYQFWIHTRAVKKLGPLEWFMNTPSHHRVHHGTNPKYIDKNYAGIFIIWDRMFGTFQVEEDEPVYGIVKPLASFNPLWANVHYWVEMARMAREAPTFADKLKVWVAPPEWRPGGKKVEIPEVSRVTQQKYGVAHARARSVFVAAEFLLVGAAVGTLDLFAGSLALREIGAATALVVVNLVTWGGLFESKRWAVPLEIARLAAVPAVVAWITRGGAAFVPLTAAAAATSVLFAAWLLVGRSAITLQTARA